MSLPSVLLMGGIISASLYLFGVLTAGGAAWGFLLITVTAFLIIYVITARLHNRREEVLIDLMRNHPTKTFKSDRLTDHKNTKDQADLDNLRTARPEHTA